MASAARYPNLPSVNFVTIDGQLVAVQDRPLTQSVLVIGPALDGPVNTVIPLNTLGDVESVYGKMVFNSTYVGPQGQTTGYSGNGLVKAVREVSAGGCADIRMLRVGGVSASGTLFFDNIIATTGNVFVSGVSGYINAVASNGGRLYNQVNLVFTSSSVSGSLTINMPSAKGPSLVFNYLNTTSGTTVSQLINIVNSFTRNTVVRLSIPSSLGIDGTQPARILTGTLTMGGGTDGTIMDDLALSKASYYNALVNGTATVPALFGDFLADYEVDIIYLADIYADDVVIPSNFTTSVAQDFANYLGRRTVDHPMLGVIGVRPLLDFSTRMNVQNHWLALTNTQSGQRGTTADNYMNFGYFLFSGFTLIDGNLEQAIDAGGYLQVVAADVLVNDGSIGLYQESAAGIYAGTLSALNPQIPATYKTVPGIFGLPYEFTRAQLDYMNGGIGADTTQMIPGGGAYVTIRRVANHGTLFVRDVTAAKRTSDFKDLQPLRIVNAVHLGIRDIVFPYLGKQNSIPNRSAMEAQVKAFLDGMADAGALLGKDGIGYFVQVLGSSPIDRLLGIIEIDVTLRPALQIKTINVKVRLSL